MIFAARATEKCLHGLPDCAVVHVRQARLPDIHVRNRVPCTLVYSALPIPGSFHSLITYTKVLYVCK
jgi:hypothetical protein